MSCVVRSDSGRKTMAQWPGFLEIYLYPRQIEETDADAQWKVAYHYRGGSSVGTLLAYLNATIGKRCNTEGNAVQLISRHAMPLILATT